MAQDIFVGTPVEIIPGIAPEVFGGGGILTRDEFNMKEYQTNIANVEKIGNINNPDLPAGTVLICHGENCSIYSIHHIRPYNPDNNNNSSMNNTINNRMNNEPTARNNRNNRNNRNSASNNPSEGNGIFSSIFGGRRLKTRKTKKSRSRSSSRK